MMEDVIEPMPPKSWAPQKAPTARIPKKFKWSGELFTDTASGLAERLCEVAMKDPSDPKDGVRISLLVSPLDSLRIHKLYTIPQLNAVFRACDGAKQFAKMGPASEKDSEAVTLFTRHMLTKRQVAVIPLSLDGSEVALLFIFPAKSDGLCNYLRVPQQMRSNEPLIAALLPWKVLSSKFAQHPAQRPLDKTLHQNSQSVAHINRQSTGRPIKKRSLAQAMKLLGFPKALLDFMAIGVRPYCVWFPSDGDAKQPGFETRLLRFILGKTQATFVSPESTVRVIFIHVGALNTLDQFPMLASRRRDSPEIQFWTYGTHHSVSCDRWGVREIYPLGGVITFTPSAILENPVDSYQIMDRASEHPLWECYLLPEVLGLVTSDVTTNNTGEISGFQGGQHDYLMPIIDLIDTRGVSVLWAPFDVDTRLSSSQWLRWQINTMGLAGEQLAEECVKAASSRYSNIPQSQLSTTVETDISQDLRRMQTQPSLVDECRRFVVIKAPSEDHIAWDRDELEWCSATKFDFMDDFFT
ncbi:hypothetical protein BJ138DRAFT_386616 [Hygrophoropsis aurantiaca]|uniref:Uncharacterized protein n=1 Tax=Hygrophoropsis aurantiaca TaxID=72124 RepID=A0ACB8APJ5_9AGAM|nr:hypothetical protein BJ138DRAFT_386616 [Hygrophoropsis aurantiaca]